MAEQSRALVPTDDKWNVMRQMADVMVQSKFLPVYIKTAEQAMAIILTGRELGIAPMMALRGLYWVRGAVATTSQMALGLAFRTGELEKYSVKGDDQACSVVIKRHGQEPHTTIYTLQDAQRANLLGKDNWKQHPRQMLQWRAVSDNLRVTFPDVLAGVYMAEELDVNVQIEPSGEMQFDVKGMAEKAQSKAIEGEVRELKEQPEEISDGAPKPKTQAAPKTGKIRKEQLPRWWKRLDDLAAGKKMDPDEYEILKKQLHKDGLTWENFQAVSQIIKAWEPGPMTQEEQRGEQLQEALGAEAEMAKDQDRERWEGEGGSDRDKFDQEPVGF